MEHDTAEMPLRSGSEWLESFRAYADNPGEQVLSPDWLHPHHSPEREPIGWFMGYANSVLSPLSHNMKLRFLLVAADLVTPLVEHAATPDDLGAWAYARQVIEMNITGQPWQNWPLPPSPHPHGRAPEVLLQSTLQGQGRTADKWLELLFEGMRLCSLWTPGWSLPTRDWATQALGAFGLGAWSHLTRAPLPTAYRCIYVDHLNTPENDTPLDRNLRRAMDWARAEYLPQWRVRALTRFAISDALRDPHIY